MNPTHKGKPDFETKSTSRSAPTKLKPFFVLAIGLAIPILAVVLSLAAWNFNERHPRTDDGVARANLIGVAPRVSGPIIKVNVSDNQSVKSGDLLGRSGCVRSTDRNRQIAGRPTQVSGQSGGSSRPASIGGAESGCG